MIKLLLPPHLGGCTDLVQPLDVCVNKPFKAVIERLATELMQNNLNGKSMLVQGECCLQSGSERHGRRSVLTKI